MAEAPFPLRAVAAAPDPRKSVVKPQATGSALVGRQVDFQVEARDNYGNRYGASQSDTCFTVYMQILACSDNCCQTAGTSL